MPADPADILSPAAIELLIEGTIFAGQLHLFDSVASTNSVAMQAAAAGAPHGSVFIAEHQSHGRGRGAHSWHSPPGGIYCSVILRPDSPPSRALWLSLSAALAVRAAVIEQLPQTAPDIRWPNDLLLTGKKFCGILSESASDSHRLRHAVVGIGLNVDQPRFPPELHATSLRIAAGSAAPLSRNALLGALLQSLHREYLALMTAFRTGSFADIRQRFERHSSTIRGARVRVHEDSVPEYDATTAGLDDDGFLLLQLDDSPAPRRLTSGGIRELAPADPRDCAAAREVR